MSFVLYKFNLYLSNRKLKRRLLFFSVHRYVYYYCKIINYRSVIVNLSFFIPFPWEKGIQIAFYNEKHRRNKTGNGPVRCHYRYCSDKAEVHEIAATAESRRGVIYSCLMQREDHWLLPRKEHWLPCLGQTAARRLRDLRKKKE